MFKKNIDNEALTVGSVLLPILEKLGISVFNALITQEIFPRSKKIFILNLAMLSSP